MVPMMARAKPKRSSLKLRIALVLVLALVIGSLAWCRWVYWQIRAYAVQDQAAPSDAIGRPRCGGVRRPPLPGLPRPTQSRLRPLPPRHRPLIITLGGSGGDQYSEGSVGRGYLEGLGVPEQAIIAETQSTNTEDQARRIAVIAHANNLRRLVIVSDGTHLFRIHEICAADGLPFSLRPVPQSPLRAARASSSATFTRSSATRHGASVCTERACEEDSSVSPVPECEGPGAPAEVRGLSAPVMLSSS